MMCTMCSGCVSTASRVKELLFSTKQQLRSDSKLSAPERPSVLASVVLLSTRAAQKLLPRRALAKWSPVLDMSRHVCLIVAAAWTVLNLIKTLEKRYGMSKAQREAATSVMGIRDDSSRDSTRVFTGTMDTRVSLSQARANAIAFVSSCLVWICATLCFF